MKPELGQEIEILIDRLTYNGGRGIGRHNNFVVFVPNTAPEDIALVRIDSVKKNFATAQLLSLKKKSPYRITPKCQYFEACGGCQWQHIDYSQQIAQKKSFLEKTLKNLQQSQITPHITSAPNAFNYRNRIQLHKLKNKVGYFQLKTHTLVNIEKCLIAEEEINNKLSEICQQPKNPLPKKFEIALTTSGQAIVRNPSLPVVTSLFSQVNTPVNQIMIQKVLKLCQGQTYSRIYDTYCGQGNFTFPILEQFSEVEIFGIELSRENIKIAKKKDPDEKISFVSNKVEKYFQKKPALKDSLVILDPPRTGCHPGLFANIKEAQRIIYVSCNLATFERDSKKLMEQGFQLNFFEGLDMFPQTSHIETIALFEKK